MPLLFSGCCFGLLWIGPPAGIFPARLPRNRLRPEMSPYRARSRSDKNAAVLTLQNTQRKDRRFYTALTGILAVPQPVRRGRSQQCPQTNSQNRTPQGIRGQVPNVSIKLPVVNGVFGEGNYIVYLEGGSVV